MSRLLLTTGKVVIFVAASTVAIPYTVAVVANLMYGWPQLQDKYRRALKPKKVLALNFALLLQLIENIKYYKLRWHARKTYRLSSNTRIVKNLMFGGGRNTLDLYMPCSGDGDQTCFPIVVYIYGSRWSGGHKEEYSLLCGQLAEHLQAVVCCPDYSTYPKGYVDDMVQDIVDCLCWLRLYATDYGGDKDRIMLIGHQSGAHLCTLTVLELTLKRLLSDPESLTLTEDELPEQPMSFFASSAASSSLFASMAPLTFQESHYSGSASDNDVDSQAAPMSSLPSHLVQSTGTDSNTNSFVVVGNNGTNDKSSDSASDFYMMDKNNDENGGSNDDSIDVDQEVADITGEMEASATESQTDNIPPPVAGMLASVPSEEPESIPSVVPPQDIMTHSQTEARDVLEAIRCVVGLSGIYDLNDHYEYEYQLGIEDISTMVKAMYAPDRLARFSPTYIISNLPRQTRLPPFTLIHSTCDQVAPAYSSDKLAAALQEMGGARVASVHVPDADHFSLCADLMEPNRPYHDIIIEILKRDALTFL